VRAGGAFIELRHSGCAKLVLSQRLQETTGNAVTGGCFARAEAVLSRLEIRATRAIGAPLYRLASIGGNTPSFFRPRVADGSVQFFLLRTETDAGRCTFHTPRAGESTNPARRSGTD
jgi:hypothetical protein